MYLAWNHVHTAEYDRVLALKEDVLRKMDEEFSLRTYVYTLAAASWALSDRGRWDEALEECQRALEAAEEFSDNSLISLASWGMAIALMAKRDLSEARKHAELALRKAPTPADKVWAHTTVAHLSCRMGKPFNGIQLLDTLVQTYRESRFVVGQLGGLVALAEGYWLAAEYDRALETAEEEVALAERCGARGYLAWAHRLLGEIVLNTNPDEAAPHFEKAIAINKEIKAENELALAYSGMGRYHKQQGNVETAREYLTKALEIFERLGTLIEPDKAREELAGL
jgi:tetratricopeptide (TPR) repeat protein